VSETTSESVVTFPSDVEIEITHSFAAPIELVFAVFTTPEHVTRTFATDGEEFKVCTIDLQVGGSYHFVLVPKTGNECVFRGTYMEIEGPRRTVATWSFDGWPGIEAVETMDLVDLGGTTQLTWRMLFPDIESRRKMTTTSGSEANFLSIDNYLKALQAI
jgi:uncharacterized protein YndB with AHSA1/START domain